VADDLLGAGVTNHRWSADIPLVPGSNALWLSARDPGSNNALQIITVTSTVP
jgi:hypothetical protein